MKKYHYFPLDAADVISKYTAGYSGLEIAQECKASANTIYACLRRNGVRVRNTREAPKTLRFRAKQRAHNQGPGNPHWKGGRIIVSVGNTKYVLVRSPNHPAARLRNGYAYEHRLIIEKELDRYLTHDESVHHINGNGLDNRRANLHLFKNNSEHTRHHAAIRKNLAVDIHKKITKGE